MANLTVAEKTHWRDRIQARIDRRIEAITAGEPGLMERIKHEARGRALGVARPGRLPGGAGPDRRPAGRAGSAGHAAPQGDAGEGPRRVGRRSRRLQPRARPPRDPCAAIGKRQTLHEEELLAGHELGRQVLRLRAERENLLDVVWLATSPTQVRELWTSGSGNYSPRNRRPWSVRHWRSRRPARRCDEPTLSRS